MVPLSRPLSRGHPKLSRATHEDHVTARDRTTRVSSTPRAVERPAVASLAPAYTPRRPSETVLYQLVRANLENVPCVCARGHYDGGLPHYVEREQHGYLKCGQFSEGFTRAHCDSCGHDLLVAFSCGSRSICPSCAGRRMSNTAAFLVDRVVPDGPLRQYVLTLPYEIRKLVAFKADVLTAVARIFVESVFASCRVRATRNGIEAPQCGAVNFVQRFGSLNLHVHYHLVVLGRKRLRAGCAEPRRIPSFATADPGRSRRERRTHRAPSDRVASPPRPRGRRAASGSLERAAHADSARRVCRDRHGSGQRCDAAARQHRAGRRARRAPRSIQQARSRRRTRAASTCTRRCASKRATISVAKGYSATAQDRRCRSNGCAAFLVGASRTPRSTSAGVRAASIG